MVTMGVTPSDSEEEEGSEMKNRAANPPLLSFFVIFFFKQKTAYEIGVRLVGSEMCIRDRF